MDCAARGRRPGWQAVPAPALQISIQDSPRDGLSPPGVTDQLGGAPDPDNDVPRENGPRPYSTAVSSVATKGPPPTGSSRTRAGSAPRVTAGGLNSFRRGHITHDNQGYHICVVTRGPLWKPVEQVTDVKPLAQPACTEGKQPRA